MGKAVDPKLKQLLRNGGDFDPDTGSDLLSGAATEQGLAWCVAQCDKARSRSAVFRAVVKAVDYPQFFGSNFDSFFDCLCDSLLDQKEGLVLVFDKLHSADPAIVMDGVQFLQVLNDAVGFARKNGRVFIFGIQHAGKHPDAKPGVVNNWSDEPA
ncbi:MAG: barstar family protein 2 [Alcaligenaceae bacterium]|nr:barstar family protein [Alcaligenaceae bacterium]PHY05746.1 MAG: barstar family protein 2 [Alcaligenaceae bacterium]